MNSKKIVKFIALITVAGILVMYCNNARAERISRFTPPPNVHPAPQPPPQQSAPEAYFYKWRSKDIVESFKEKGLEVEDAKPAYTMSPISPLESTLFLMPSYGENIGGYISSYNSADDLKKMKKYYLKMNEGRESPAWYVFDKDNILLLISGRVPEKKAALYEKVLKEIDKK